MTKKYTLHVLEEDGNFYHCVFEEATKQVTDILYFHDDAMERMNFLESGGAFAGFTPSFILNEVKFSNKKESLNTKVSTL